MCTHAESAQVVVGAVVVAVVVVAVMVLVLVLVVGVGYSSRCDVVWCCVVRVGGGGCARMQRAHNRVGAWGLREGSTRRHHHRHHHYYHPYHQQQQPPPP
jgi:hypothetical protein